MEVLIRYNNKYNSDIDRWRLLIDDNEFLCSNIQIKCESETCSKAVMENGQMIEKWHIRVYNFNEIIFQFGSEGRLIVLII